MLRRFFFASMIVGGLAHAEQNGLTVHVQIAPLSRSDASSLQQQATPVTDFTVRPSLLPIATLHDSYRGPQSLSLMVECHNDFGELIPDCYVTFSLTQQEGSGGHIHNTSGNTARPAGGMGTGVMVPNSIRTGPNGEPQPVTYQSPRTSGIIDWRLDAMHPDGRTGSVTYTIGILVPQLVQMPLSGSGYTIANTMNHGRANWLTVDMLSRVQQLPAEFARSVSAGTQVPTLVYTALNLEMGGLYDIHGNWDFRPLGHRSHDDGRHVDIGVVSRDLRPSLGLAIENSCLTGVPNFTRWQFNGCLSQPIRRESTSDDNSTHYHVQGW